MLVLPSAAALNFHELLAIKSCYRKEVWTPTTRALCASSDRNKGKSMRAMDRRRSKAMTGCTPMFSLIVVAL